MEPTEVFGLSVGALVVLTALVLFTVRAPLFRILDELCNGAHRATFWLRLYCAATLLTVLFCALLRTPRADDENLHVGLMVARFGLFGLIASISALAVLMLAFISGHERRKDRLAARAGTTD